MDGLRDASSCAGKSRNYVAGEEARNPRGAGDLCGETPTLSYFKASKVGVPGSPGVLRPRE
jgi:hypothetical protein